MIARRHFTSIALFSIASYAGATGSFSQNSQKTGLLPTPDNLPALSRQAQASGQALVLMASLPGCPWCELLRRNYLNPMRKEGVHAYEFMINDSRQPLMDFSGAKTTPAQWSDRQKISIAPTLLFFNSQGQEIVPRIEGVASAELIGSLLEDRLALARAKIAKQKS